ncbi:hypothetical protein RD110_08700 [Rhodoferax koreense]|uniref:Alpha/beta hydrolase n=1 Tax=Rhodoferax koreensis TaxID=1842727 RepID=A0A1P8JU21_9BURK|nr:hypothetical protein RD110_08700 [Rhodoferax koreense]
MRVHIGPNGVEGELCLPPLARGLVIFAPGSGGSGHNACHLCVTKSLHGQGLGALLVDLLTPREAHDRTKVFDIDLLSDRLTEAIEWTRSEAGVRDLPIGLFGAEIGGAAVLAAAAANRDRIFGVVTHGGRPDMVMPMLRAVRTPTLLIASDADPLVLALNRLALDMLKSNGQIAVIASADLPADGAAANEQIAQLAAEWFAARLATAPQAQPQARQHA